LQPLAGSEPQLGVSPTHWPAEQRSPVVQAFPSEHRVVLALGVAVHCPCALQTPVLQASSQLGTVLQALGGVYNAAMSVAHSGRL
jgi:hypothetical protein